MIQTPQMSPGPTSADRARTIVESALSYLAAGRSALPVGAGSKVPGYFDPTKDDYIHMQWKKYQRQRPDAATLRRLFQHGTLGVSIVTGKVSGTEVAGICYSLEIMDFDDLRTFEDFLEAANFQGRGELLARLVRERTPRLGGHLGYLCATVERNQPLARRPPAAGEDRPMVLIETRGEGGQCVVAPTPPGVHPDVPERGYTLTHGHWEDPPMITAEERAALFTLARSFNRYVDPTQVHTPPSTTRLKGKGARPGDALNARADRAWWTTLLEKSGWTCLGHRGEIQDWQRPGKAGPGASATLGACGPYFYVFSSNAAPFEAERAYSAFSALTLLEHQGDFQQAARALAAHADPAECLAATMDEEAGDRTEASTGAAFFAVPVAGKRKVFTPKLLGDALMARRVYRYTARQLWVYQAGAYRPDGEATLRQEAQTLLGNEKRVARTLEAQDYVEVATHLGDAVAPDQDYINCRNGRLHVHTLILLPHTPEIFSIAQLPVDYDKDATCPTFTTYLATTLEAEDIPLIQEILGWCLIPTLLFERAVMLTGGGKNGKGVCLDVVGWLLGEANIAHNPLQDLEENRFRVAELYGKLANIFADLPNRRLVTSSMFKTLVSGDPITAERKHQHPFSFRNYAKLLFSANELPGTNDRTYAFYRRWLIIPFERTFNGADGNPAPDQQLRAKLKQELSGILNYALIGLHRLLTRGEFTETPHTLAATQRYMHANDSVQAFIAECVTIDKDATVSKREFWAVYRSWCDMLHKRLVSQTKLKEALYTAVPGLDEVRPSRTDPWEWLGMTLNEAAQTYRPYTRGGEPLAPPGEGGANGQESDAPF